MRSNKKSKKLIMKNIRNIFIFTFLTLAIGSLVYVIKKPQILDSNAMSVLNSVYGAQTKQNSDYTYETFYLGPYKTALYYPSGSTKYAAPYPVIVFHHGMMAKSDYYTWFAEAMVKKGYIVAVPNRLLLGVNLDTGTKMTSTLLDYLSIRNKYTGSLHKKIDLTRVGIAGHSMGGDLTLYGANLQTKYPSSIKALVAIAPASKDTEAMKVVMGATQGVTLGKYIESTMNNMYNTVSTNQTPTMFLVGSLDGIALPQATQSLYNLNKSKKMLAVLNGANHVQFSPVGTQQASEIEDKLDKKPTMSDNEVLELTKTYVGAWMDYFVKGEDSAKTILEQGKGLVPSKFTTYTLAY
jgi:predicted dienelactone hydrolase